MKTLYLIRHGEVLNPKGADYRRLPGFHLSDLGKRQVEKASEALKDIPLEVIWHSPLERAMETAVIINKLHNVPLIQDERIHEWAHGEPDADVVKRLGDFLQHFLESKYEVAAAVSHKDPIRRLLIYITSNWITDMWIESIFPLNTGGVYKITDDGNQLSAECVLSQ